MVVKVELHQRLRLRCGPWLAGDARLSRGKRVRETPHSLACNLTDQELGNNDFRFAATSRSLTSAMDMSMDSRRHASENEPELSPLEQEVLDEYAKLVGNLDNVSDSPVRD